MAVLMSEASGSGVAVFSRLDDGRFDRILVTRSNAQILRVFSDGQDVFLQTDDGTIRTMQHNHEGTICHDTVIKCSIKCPIISAVKVHQQVSTL